MHSRVCTLAVLVLLFGSVASASSAVANFVGTDTQTQGSWQGVYGADGYQLAQSSQNVPPYASFAVQNELDYTWSASTTDPRALQVPGSGRIAATWFSNDHLAVPFFTFDLNFTDGNTHQFALYALDWDNTGRMETIQVQDANTQAVLDTRSIKSFSAGMYVIWNISGHVTITVTLAGGTNAVVSGAFFGGSNSNGISVSPASVSLSNGQQQPFTATQQNVPNPSVSWSISPSVGSISSSGVYLAPSTISSNQTVTVTATSTSDSTKYGTANVNLTTAALANFVGSDTSTSGNWQGVYGSDGYVIANSNQSVPTYAIFGAQNLLGYTWVGSTTDLRALENGTGGHTATAWYSSHFYNPPTIDFDINFADGNSHQLALYAVDWDYGGRVETFQVTDATTNAVLDTRTISNFTNGVYLIWNVSGHVQINVSYESGSNVVVSGAFFGGSSGGTGGGGSISVGVTPSPINLGGNGAQQFTATVTGSTNQNVTWSINPSAGTISTSGNYKAPVTVSSAQQVTVKATSAADGITFGTATVNLTPASAVANFVLSDTTTQGNWEGVYGADGYAIANSIQSIPTYASFSDQSDSVFTWNSSTTDTRALEVGTGRIASTYYNNPSLNFNVSFTDGNSHQLALYALDWDNGGRSETVQIFDASTNALLDTRPLSSFSGGTYLVWNISGSVRIKVTLSTGANAAISGLFLGAGGTVGISVNPPIVGLSGGQQQQFSATNPNVTWSITGSGTINTSGLYQAPSTISSAQQVTVTATSASDSTVFGTATVNLSPGASATFASMDTTTQGNWQVKYGADGYSVANDSQSIPAYATFAVQNDAPYTWNAAPNDQRALERGGSNGRIASCWYYVSSFNFDVNFTDGNPHQFELYALDWDSSGRTETIQIVDPSTNTVLDTRNVSNFSTGVYLIWNISGHVKINVTLTGGPNPVVSGAFFK